MPDNTMTSQDRFKPVRAGGYPAILDRETRRVCVFYPGEGLYRNDWVTWLRRRVYEVSHPSLHWTGDHAEGPFESDEEPYDPEDGEDYF